MWDGGQGTGVFRVVTKSPLAQQGGYGLTNKGPQHDEAWLIFMDQVNNQLPTFEDKAEALHYFPMWRTWFGLCGFCKLPWNDVVDPKNAEADEPAEDPAPRPELRRDLQGVTGQDVTDDDLIAHVGAGLRTSSGSSTSGWATVCATTMRSRTAPPARDRRGVRVAGGRDTTPSCATGSNLDPETMTLEEKLAAQRAHRLPASTRSLIDAVYARRGWTSQGVPTPETCGPWASTIPGVAGGRRTAP
ncbi:MAG: aldehyde ferredoxin oxidoreductase C-terminal domain-containing protein [Bacteroidales bacterium]|nr:aldehyde ferredoxin oxidoreductase C-terminal domain-containing protein [Bacteroidales bacterium]